MMMMAINDFEDDNQDVGETMISKKNISKKTTIRNGQEGRR